MTSTKIKEPVKIRRKNLANGNVSLYLAIYVNGQRSYEFLKLYLILEKSKADKERNKNTLALANSIKAQRIIDIQNGEHGFKTTSKKTLFLEYMKALGEKRKKEESRGAYSNWHACILHIMAYDPRKNLTFADITPKWVEGFRDYLDYKAQAFGCERKKKHKEKKGLGQNTKQNYFVRLGACLKQACEDNIIRDNPMKGIKGFEKKDCVKQYLTVEEMQAMAATECDYPEIRRAFLFACLTGLRRSDIEKLKWGEVTELGGRTRLEFRQKKTGSQEYLDITPQAAELIGKRGTAKPADSVFGYLPTPYETNHKLRIWAMKAGIDKHITFHSGRHTFAVMMLTLGTDLYTVSKLLGHRAIRTTEVYAKIVDKKKQEAVDIIPDILQNQSIYNKE